MKGLKQWTDFVAKNTKQLSAGDYIVGQQIDKGMYDVTFNGSDNFIVYDGSGSVKTNEILGSSIGVSSVVINLEDNDIINTSGVDTIQIEPTN